MIKFEKASQHDIRIKHTINGGIIVKIGCAELCFNDYRLMMEAMQQYYQNPVAMETIYNKAMEGCEVPMETERGTTLRRGSISSSSQPINEEGCDPLREEACDDEIG